MKYILLLFVLLGSFTLFLACDKENSEAAFDRSKMLENYARNIIQPQSADFRAKILALQEAIELLLTDTDEAKLATAQDKWEKSYKAWMKMNSFNFGPGGTEGLRRTLAEEIGTWPVDIENIEAKIADPNFVLNDSKRNTRGLLAIEYLLFETEHINTVNDWTTARKEYLQAVINKLEGQVAAFDEAWQGTYANEFIDNDGTAVRSSTTQMYNEFIRSYESIKDLKIGIPFGSIAGTVVRPEFVEARFSQHSLEYALLHYAALVDLWYGRKANGEDGIGWEEYLLSVEGGAALVADTKAQFDKIETAIAALPTDTPLQELAVSQNQAVLDFEQALQELTRYLKGDLSSLLSLAITFSSMDGD
ncbi:MAG: imelysin family protein [Bacteroidota bacterium]